MTTNLRIILYNCQSFRSNISIVKQLLEKCDVFFLQETLFTQFNANELDQLTDINTIACFKTATASTSLMEEGPEVAWLCFGKHQRPLTSFLFYLRIE